MYGAKEIQLESTPPPCIPPSLEKSTINPNKATIQDKQITNTTAIIALGLLNFTTACMDDC
jgi:hypothetical protein